MFVRLTFLNVAPEKKEELRKVYTEQVIPTVKKQKGNLGIRLLEPTNENKEFVSMTEWESASDADLYDSSGTYQALLNSVKDAYVSKPVLNTYNVVEAKVAAVL